MSGFTDDKVIEKIATARVGLLINKPFFGQLATRLVLKDATDWMPTAGTDGRYFYYNRDFIESLNKEEMLFLFGHEVFHNVYAHMSRRGSRDARLWNCAADFVINLELVEHKVGKLIHHPGKIEPCYDTRFKGMSTEEVYAILEKEQEQGKGDANQDSFDVHIDPNSGKASGAGKEEGDEEGGSGSGPVPMTEDERRMLQEEIKHAVMNAAKAQGAGNLPAGVKRLIGNLEEPKMDWRQILTQELLSIYKTDFTFARPSRKSWSTGGAILPGMPPDFKAEVAVALDTSGSMSESQLRDLLGEVMGIMNQFADFELTLWCFDTKTYNVEKFTPENKDELDDYKIAGGGGTSFEVNWELMEDMDFVPNKLVVFTDGYPCGTWGTEDYCDTIFLIHGTKTIEAPFGTTCYYEED